MGIGGRKFIKSKKESGGVGPEAAATRRHAKYPRSYEEYAADYNCTARTIKSWVRSGKEKGDLPPLDDSLTMGFWLARHLPGKLAGAVRSAVRKSSDVTPASHGGQSQNRESPPTADLIPRDFSNIRSLDIAQNVEELRHTLAINKQLLDEALKGRDENLTSLRQRNYKDVFELLRKAEDTLANLQKQRGDLVDKESVRSEISQALELLRLMRETMPRRIMTELVRILPRRLSRIFSALEKFLTVAVDKARTEEENIFRNLENIGGPAGASSTLAT